MQVIAGVPVLCAAEDYPARFIEERQSPAVPHRGDAEAREAENMRLLGSDLARFQVLNDGIGLGPYEWEALHLREPGHVVKKIGHPLRIDAVEELRHADSDRLNRLDVDRDVIVALNHHKSAGRKI